MAFVAGTNFGSGACDPIVQFVHEEFGEDSTIVSKIPVHNIAVNQTGTTLTGKIFIGGVLTFPPGAYRLVVGVGGHQAAELDNALVITGEQ